MNKATKEELVRYYTLTKYFEYCDEHYDRKYGGCWNYDQPTYNPETMLSVCPHKTMKRVITLILEMLKGKHSWYYALNLKELTEIEKIVDAKFKEKAVKI
jgi:hypothetical protein